MRSLVRRLRADSRGVTVIEFAFVAPVMLLTIMGFGDLAYRGYAQSLLEGAVQKAGRDAALEGGSTRNAAIDAAVAANVRQISKDATFKATRDNFEDFASVGKPEEFTDKNDNKKYDVGECYFDVNNNKSWDSDPKTSGQGGADDVVVYQVTMTYPRVFPLGKMLGWTEQQEITAKTLLKNQPFASQNKRTPVSRCT